MPSDRDSTDTTSQNTSAGISPSITRTPSHYESVTRENDEDTAASSGTVRRNRPLAISTSTGNYGTLMFDC